MCNYYSNNIIQAGRDTTAATEGRTEGLSMAKLLPHTAHSG